MMSKRLLIPLLLFLTALCVSAQESDFGIWYELNGNYNIVKGLRFDLETSIRTDKNASNIGSFYVEPGLRYKFNDYFNAGIYYRFIEKEETIDKSEGIYKFYPRHRWFIQLKGNLPINRFTLSARYRFQEQIKTYIEDPGDEVPQWVHRLRLELDYDIKGIPLKPYINAEAQSIMFEPDDIAIENWRYMAGAEYTFYKKHTVGLEYIYNVSKTTKPTYTNIIGLTYSINL